MALKDLKVYLFALMTCSQLLGLGFINFFPTSVAFHYIAIASFSPKLVKSIAGTLGFSTTVTLLLAACVG